MKKQFRRPGSFLWLQKKQVCTPGREGAAAAVLMNRPIGATADQHDDSIMAAFRALSDQVGIFSTSREETSNTNINQCFFYILPPFFLSYSHLRVFFELLLQT